MKLKHLFTMLFLAFMCVIALNTAEETSALTTPSLSWETVSYNSSNYVHTIKFTITSDGTRHFIKIARKDGQYEHTYETTSKTLTWTPSWAGEYTAFVTSHGDGTYLSSSVIDIYVGRPYEITVSGDADVVAKGQTINLTYKSSDKDATYNLHIKNASTGSDVESFGGTKNTTYPYSTKNLSPGNYYAQLYASNGTGGENGDKFWFTVVGGEASASLKNTENLSNDTIVHGNLNYSFTISSTVNGTVNNANFKVTATYGSEVITLYSVSNGKVNSIHASVSSPSIALNASFGDIGSKGNKTVTFKVNTSHADFDRGVTYTVQVAAGTVDLAGLDRGNGTDVTVTASGTHKFKTTSGDISVNWVYTATVPSNSIVAGKYTYTITVTNGTNHKIKNVAFTVTMDGTTIVTVGTDGKVTYTAPASGTVTSITNSASSNGTVQLTVTISASSINDSKQHTFKVGSLSAVADGISGSNSGYSPTAKINATEHKITKATGTVTVDWKPTTTVPTNSIVAGNYTYTITVTNGTTHGISGIAYKVTMDGTAIATIKADGSVVYASPASGNTTTTSSLNAGGTVTLTVTIKTGSINDNKQHTFKIEALSANDTGVVGDGANSYTPAVSIKASEHKITKATGTVTVDWKPTTTVPTNSIVAGNYTYTITVTNGTTHGISGIAYKVTMDGTAIATIKADGSVVYASPASGNTTTTSSLNAGGTVTLTVTIKTGSINDNKQHTFKIEGLTSNDTNVVGDGASSYNPTNSISATEHKITKATGTVTVDWKPTTTVPTNSIVAGKYVYTITVTNGTTHGISGIAYKVTMDGTAIATIKADGSVEYASPASGNTTTTSSLNKNGTVTLEVTIDASKIGNINQHTFKIEALSANDTGVVGDGASSYNPAVSIEAAEHKITVAGGSITVGLTSTTVNNNGVGEGDVNYTITLKNETNHPLKGITFTLEMPDGTKLLTVNNDGSITVHDAVLVKNTGVTIDGNLSNLASGSTVTITGIVIDAKASKLDEVGKLVLVAKGNSADKDVVGSLGGTLTYSDNSDAFTIMVRHDVNLLVQSGVITNIDAEKILAAMEKSGATIYNGITGISAVTVTDINGKTIDKIDEFQSNGSALIIELTAEYREYIIQVSYSGGTILVPIQVSTVSGGDDKTFVLDYGLPVSIDKATMLDDVRLTGGAYANITNAVSGFSANFGETASLNLTGIFGNFSYENNAFDYTTTKFINDEDVAYIVVLVGDANGTENVDFVKVYKKISFIPSNVIYYEDSLVGSITYPVDFELTELGELAAIGSSLTQDLPETGNMGFDDGSYANSQDVTISGESVQKVPIYNQEVTVSFTVTGTGFELISRVNAEDAATILVMVRPQGGTDEDWVYYPVITRFDPNGNGNAEVYQVPVFRLNNGEYKTYEVQVMGLPVQDYNENGDPIPGTCKPSYIYIDGIRVYNPLGLDNPLTNNYGVEQGAEFTNLRDLILAGKGMVAEWNGNITGFTAGSYYYLGTSERFTAALGSVNELGAIGANNEILIRQSAGNHMVVLKVQETVAGEGLLQIGIHDIHDAKFDGDDGENLPSTVSYKTAEGWAILKADFKSGTEQYYSIDLSNCPTDGEYKLVILQVDSGFVSFTNIKHKNVEFGSTGAEVLDIYTESGYFFNEDGDMCTIIYGDDENSSEDDVVQIVANADQVLNINTINGILATSSVENETV